MKSKGPIEYDVLTLQDKHRSQKIWNGEISASESRLIVRRHDYDLWQHLKNNTLHTRILNYFDYTGFRGVLEVGNIPCYSSIITALVERWRPKTHTFHMRTGETTIPMQDMKVMFGMVVDGTSILLPNAKSMDLFARQTLIFNLTSWFPMKDCFQGFRIFSPSLVNYIETSNVINDNSTELEVQQKFRLYLFWLLGGTLFPDKSGNKFNSDFFIEMGDLQALATQAWGAATLSYLYHSLCRASICDISIVNGFISLLQRIIPFQPMISPFNNDQPEEQKPLAYKWS
ncbi:hypothetical protein R3W88_001066 [Solanum pinnatisectum]|uniref:Aminotransferase-like plant mobile domain-containing protein n=1 Tax=Solanum pinnatisectum TaxID=50273 RepID=A0AAV9MJW2_9SOLN|nr:hypothetical protein R3W88_001066 [Solanum pinnatisectum]